MTHTFASSGSDKWCIPCRIWASHYLTEDQVVTDFTHTPLCALLFSSLQ